MPVLRTAERDAPAIASHPQHRDFDRLRMRSCPSGHSRIEVDQDSETRPLLLIWMRGGGVVRQHGRAVTAAAGSLCFLPNDAPVWLCDVGEGGAVALELPSAVQHRAREHVAVALGGVITCETGAAAMLRGFLDALDHQPASYRPEFPGWVQTCVCDITERVLEECVGATPSASERALLVARNFVDAHLTDPDLTPQRVAREAAVSLRTLNRLFAAEHDSVGACIRQHRLERCAADLHDPGKDDRTISQIGALWGFPEAAHFSRVFKDAYGCSPRAYRTSGSAVDQQRAGHADAV